MEGYVWVEFDFVWGWLVGNVIFWLGLFWVMYFQFNWQSN